MSDLRRQTEGEEFDADVRISGTRRTSGGGGGQPRTDPHSASEAAALIGCSRFSEKPAARLFSSAEGLDKEISRRKEISFIFGISQEPPGGRKRLAPLSTVTGIKVERWWGGGRGGSLSDIIN